MEPAVGPRIQVTIPTDAGIVSENQSPRTSQHNDRSQQPGSPEYHNQGEETIAKEKEAEPPESIPLPATIPNNASKHPNLQLPTRDNTEEGSKFVTEPLGIHHTQAALGQPPGSRDNTEEENKSITKSLSFNNTPTVLGLPSGFWDNTEEENKFVTEALRINNTQSALGLPPGFWDNTEEENKFVTEPLRINNTQTALDLPPGF